MLAFELKWLDCVCAYRVECQIPEFAHECGFVPEAGAGASGDRAMKGATTDMMAQKLMPTPTPVPGLLTPSARNMPKSWPPKKPTLYTTRAGIPSDRRCHAIGTLSSRWTPRSRRRRSKPRCDPSIDTVQEVVAKFRAVLGFSQGKEDVNDHRK
jgi:hypothetical protein